MPVLTNASFEQLITQYENLVYTVCRQLTQDATAAEDLMQETFLSAYLHLDRCPPGSEKPWLVRIAVNKSKDYLQSAYSRHTLLPGDDQLPPGDASPSAEQLVLEGVGYSGAEGLINALREPYGSVCRLNLLEEKTPEETALALGRPVKTVRTQLARGKLMLREQLEGSERNGDYKTRRTS